jgi:hypothetical protein
MGIPFHPKSLPPWHVPHCSFHDCYNGTHLQRNPENQYQAQG